MKITIDYRFDTKGFFADPIRKTVLEKAVSVWENWLKDDFPTVPSGIEFTVMNPETGILEKVILESEIDDLLLFVGSQSPPFGEPGVAIAKGGVSGVDPDGSIFFNRYHSSNFEPWVGVISFDPSPQFNNGEPSSWFFDETPATAEDIPINSSDFFTTTLHEIGHVLGFGTSPIFNTLTENGFFTGENSLNLNNNNPIPLESDLSHIKQNFSSQSILMLSANSGRVFPSQFDLAILADIGYEIEGFTQVGENIPLATAKEDSIFGTILADEIQGLGGDDSIQGNSGNDTLDGGFGNDLLFGEKGLDYLFGNEGNDEIQGGEGDDFLSGGEGDDSLFGQVGRDRFLLTSDTGNDTINDFEIKDDLLQISPKLNINNISDLKSKISLEGNVIGGGIFTEFTFSPSNIVTVLHDQPLEDDNFVFQTSDLPWDVNKNGTISPTDVIFILNRLGFNNSQGDLDHNGILTKDDAIAVINHFADTL